MRAADVDRCIVADIGGTNARLGLWQAGAGLLNVHARRYRNDDFADLLALIERYRADVGEDAAATAAHALLAVALPVAADAPRELRMTNRPWTFTPEGLRAALGLASVRLVNDFAAAAAGIGALRPSEQTQWGGTQPRDGPQLVLGPGTGLGAAILVAGADAARVLPSEAGHMAAAPTDAIAGAALERLRRHGRVSWERLLCGNGLALFDAAVRGAAAADEPAAVARRVHAGDTAALDAARAYANALGEFAGDLCLALRATGGVWLVGGVLDGLGGALDAAALRAGFENKGRLAAVVRATPIFRVHAHDLALRGLQRLLSGAIIAPMLEARAGFRQQPPQQDDSA